MRLSIREFLFFFFGLAVGVPIVMFGISFLADNIRMLAGIVLMSLVVAVVACVAIVMFRDAILSKLYGTAKIELDDFSRPIASSVTAMIDGDQRRALDGIEQVARRILARYSWVLARRWMLGAIVALVATFATLAGAALVFRQNSLLEQQNVKLDSQNRLLVDQTRVLKEQNALVLSQNDLVETQATLMQGQNDLLEIESQLMEASRRSGLAFELSRVLDLIHELVEVDPTSGENTDGDGRMMLIHASDHLAGRIVALSRAVRPYRYLESDGTLSSPRSPERAQLLLSLLACGVDLRSIIETGVDFTGADFRGVSLSHVKLIDQCLDGMNLDGVNLEGAQLRNCSMIGTSLRGANLRGTDLNSANLAGADLHGADLSEADLAFAQVENADLGNAILERASLSGASLQAANIEGARLQGASIGGANFRGAQGLSADKMRSADGWDLAWFDDNVAAGLRGVDIETVRLERPGCGEAHLWGTVYVAQGLLPDASSDPQGRVGVSFGSSGRRSASIDNIWCQAGDERRALRRVQAGNPLRDSVVEVRAGLPDPLLLRTDHWGRFEMSVGFGTAYSMQPMVDGVITSPVFVSGVAGRTVRCIRFIAYDSRTSSETGIDSDSNTRVLAAEETPEAP